MENYSVTIAREYGSGGRIIGKGLAEELGLA
ncbi:MAG: cytidylate kinase-like family protein, partial [Synergistaceae bacterium]|nr:cytidylate kinase-like family protein [Synergistaceae bacterium]